MGRLIDAYAFSAFIKDAVIKHKYDRLNIDNTLTVADVLQSVCAELDGTGLEGFKNAPTVDAVPARHGKWVDENGNRPYGYRFNWLCSECGRPQHTSTAKLLKEFEEEHRWCHFCGARMDGDNHEG